MEKARIAVTGLRGKYGLAVLFLSMFIFVSGTFFLSSMAYADDATDSRDGAIFTASTLVLDLPELAVEGTDLLYSAQLQLKQEGEDLILELINLAPSKYSTASVAAATLSTDGLLQIPLLNIEGAFYKLDLEWISAISLLPIRFSIKMGSIEAVPIEHFDDSILGVSKSKCIRVCTPWGCFSICSVTTTSGGGKPKPKPFTY